ncbi:DUF2177 family protein [Agrobacterium larrymoorei]|uniref:DUF2177 family protein n=1 Tax=Agrobacterium larrymoorei TaxID=160699 RepID=A0A4D7DNN0_9HYPH|nr:DUF2177 family protein [Agrobacterium larrymoorei]QCI97234.1 DUF2177 family protein [Agrobacterium larrymoorei]QYA07334.1 DUF2177 family protein [Agrobacterium larrymoorei]
MKRFVIAYLATMVFFLAIDAIWLSTMADLLYRPLLGDLLAPQFRLAPAVLFYLIYCAALTYFAVLPGLDHRRLSLALRNGAFFGFAAYGTYDLTNQATLVTWPTTLTIADLIWGSVLSAATALCACWLTGRLHGRSDH